MMHACPLHHCKLEYIRPNVRSTYLYGKLDEEHYMEFPEGFILAKMKGKILRLVHVIYGLKQARLA